MIHNILAKYITGFRMAPRGVYSPRSMFMPHEGAKQNLKAQFAYDKEGNKLKGARWSNALERVVIS